MLKQEYRFGIYYFNREEPQDARLIEEVSFCLLYTSPSPRD